MVYCTAFCMKLVLDYKQRRISLNLPPLRLEGGVMNYRFNTTRLKMRVHIKCLNLIGSTACFSDWVEDYELGACGEYYELDSTWETSLLYSNCVGVMPKISNVEKNIKPQKLFCLTLIESRMLLPQKEC